jgi:hypothetical protein
MEINDTLKLKAYGWKKDYIEKQPHIQKVYQEHKQYYPEDSHGVIDEWQALIRNQAEIYRQEERMRKEKEFQAKENYRQELDRQMKEKQFQDEMQKRAKDSYIKDQAQRENFKNQMNWHIKSLENNERQGLFDEYQRNLDEHKRQALDNKKRELMEDKNMLDKDRFRGRDSQRVQKDKNLKYKQELDNVADYHNYLKNQLGAEEKRKEDEDYLRGCQRENEKRDKEREDWYNKYKNFSDNMDDRLKTTLAQAKPSLDRKNQRDKKIEENHDKYGNKMFDDYEKEREKMKGMWKNAYNENQRNLKDKTRATQASKLKDKEDMENKARESLAYNQNEEKRRREMEEQRNLYKETLQNQMTLNALNRHNYGKMTLEEKRLNKEDLRSYKNKESNNMHAMIPGIKNIEGKGLLNFNR